MILVYITAKNGAEAKKIAKRLLALRLISCANIFPIQSLYRWKGKPVFGKETALLCKTADSKYLRIVKEVESMHSYDVACALKIPFTPNPRYGKWLLSEINSGIK